VSGTDRKLCASLDIVLETVTGALGGRQ